MAINVNTVYTTVLSILNKEQRGYLTPDEFNKLATQVQLEIFEKFFDDYNQYIRMPKTNVEFASRMEHIKEEFQVFEKLDNASAAAAGGVYTQPTDLHRFGTAYYQIGVGSPEIQIVSERESHQLNLSPLTTPTLDFPIATYKEDKLKVSPSSSVFATTDVSFSYMRKPADVVWAFSIGSLGQYVYEPTATGTGITPSTGTVQFELSDAQQTEVILGILKYAGVIIRDPQIVQAAAQELAQEEVNSKR